MSIWGASKRPTDDNPGAIHVQHAARRRTPHGHRSRRGARTAQRIRHNGMGLGARVPAALRRRFAPADRRSDPRRLGLPPGAAAPHPHPPCRRYGDSGHRHRHPLRHPDPGPGGVSRPARHPDHVAARGARRGRTCHRPRVAGDAFQHRRRPHAPLSAAVPHRRPHRDSDRVGDGEGDRALRHLPGKQRGHLRLRAQFRNLEQAAAQPDTQSALHALVADQRELRCRPGGGAQSAARNGRIGKPVAHATGTAGPCPACASSCSSAS